MEAGAARGAAGEYPVDILEDDPDGYRATALAYYTALRAGAQPATEVFSLPTGEQVRLEVPSVRFCTVHRDEPQHKILVLVSPRDTKTVVAVYMKGSWWATEDVLRTSDPAREGLMKVQSFGERIVLFILNVVIFGRLERMLDGDDMFFLPYSGKEEAKVLWRDSAAVGFYTTKAKGSLCGDGTGACYLLPVFDTVFVRRRHRRQGLGTAMLQDFCETFHEEGALGVSWPISPAMYQVCRKFLSAHPEEQGRLWEVEPPGAWGQRDSIWLKVQLPQSQLADREDRWRRTRGRKGGSRVCGGRSFSRASRETLLGPAGQEEDLENGGGQAGWGGACSRRSTCAAPRGPPCGVGRVGLCDLELPSVLAVSSSVAFEVRAQTPEACWSSGLIWCP